MRMMWTSLKKLIALPADTAIYCGHEYTQANIKFALGIEPGNTALQKRAAEVDALRVAGKPTLPTTMALELATNPFLRVASAEIQERLAMQGRDILCAAFNVKPNAPDSMLGCLAAVSLPPATPEHAAKKSKYHDALQDALLERYSIEVPIVPWPAPPRRLVRISAQLYNTEANYEQLGRALEELLAIPR